MILICQKNHAYGQMPRIPAKQAKDMDLDPKAYHGGVVQSFEAGQEYDVEPRLASRLLRDYGPARGRGDVRFVPKNPNDYIALLTQTGQANKVSLGEVLERGYITPDAAGTEQQVDIEAAGIA